MEMMIPLSQLNEVVIENQTLYKKLEKAEKANKLLKDRVIMLYTLLKEKEDAYTFQMGRGQQHPSYKKNATADKIIKAIHDDRLESASQVAEKLGVSYSTVRRRLMQKELFPISLKKIDEEYEILDGLGIGLW